MYYDNQEIKPFEGIGDIKIGETYENIVSILKLHKIIYSMGINLNKGSEPQIEWKTIYIKNYMNLVFAADILWRIDFIGDFKGKLKNGIEIGIDLSRALELDNTLEFDDWDEVFCSKEGYWLIDFVDTGKVVSFSIGIKEISSEDEFYSYEWLKKYKTK
jgi:hypothetical protein